MTTDPLWRREPLWSETQIRRVSRPTEISGARRGLPRSGTHRRLILNHIVAMERDGATSDECSHLLDVYYDKYVPPNQVASRIGELVDEGWVEDSGMTRKTRRGGDAIVWTYKERL